MSVSSFRRSLDDPGTDRAGDGDEGRLEEESPVESSQENTPVESVETDENPQDPEVGGDVPEPVLEEQKDELSEYRMPEDNPDEQEESAE